MTETKRPSTQDQRPFDDASPVAPRPAWEEALLTALLQPLREDAARKAVVEEYGLDHASIEAFLRSPEARRRMADSLSARLVELTPVTIQNLSPEILARKGWAIKLLLDALCFQKVANQILENTESQADVIISSAFERELVQNLLDTLRGKPGQDAAKAPKGDEK